MISKEIKKLSRRELVDIIYQLKKNEEKMQSQIASLEEALQEKRVRISVAGSIAEAALDITNIFSTAQTAADLYLHEIAHMKEDTEKECAKMIEEAHKKVDEIIGSIQKQCVDLTTQYQLDYQKLQKLQTEIQRLENKTGINHD